MTAKEVAWVAGVGHAEGIGASVARRFARAGMLVAVSGRRTETLDAVITQVEQQGGEAIAVPGDLSQPEEVVRIGSAIAALGTLSVGVYNAGNNRRLPLLDMDPADFEDMWRTACFGAYLTGREMLKALLRRKQGTLIFTGATASLRGKPDYAAFSAAKAGMRMIAQAFAREAGPSGVHVAHAIIDGRVGGAGDPRSLSGDAIAEAYWGIHSQPSNCWSHEIEVRSADERF